MKQAFVAARRSGQESFRSRRPWASRVTATATVAVAVCLVAGVGGAARASAQDNGGELARFVRQPVAWHTCRNGPDDDLGATLDEIGAQCAEVTVPLDYARPTGGTLKVAISRRKATDTAHRIGTLVVNPGGPGEGIGSGLTWVVQGMPPYVASGAPAVAARYDLVGIDPRFQNRSSPLECGWPNNQVEQAGYVGPDRWSFERSVALNAELANRCAPYAHLLPYASTRNAARDPQRRRTRRRGRPHPGPVQCRDRRRDSCQRRHRQGLRLPHPHQARPRQPDSDRPARPRHRMSRKRSHSAVAWARAGSRQDQSGSITLGAPHPAVT